MTIPGVYFVGPQKSGTTWIYKYLSGHEEIDLATTTKETFFFDFNYEKGLAWYEKQFPGSRRAVEVAPTYFHSRSAPARIKHHAPNAKIIITIRDPLKRAFSLYLHEMKKGRFDGTFQEALSSCSIIKESSRYGDNISRWLDLFGGNNVKILFVEDLKENPIKFVEELCDFIGITPIKPGDDLSSAVNEASLPKFKYAARFLLLAGRMARHFGLYRILRFADSSGLKRFVLSGRKQSEMPRLSSDDLKRSYPLFAQEIDYLEFVTGRDLSSWRLAEKIEVKP